MKNLVFATNNVNKVKEIKLICPPEYNIISLKDAGITQEIEEPFFTLEENAKEKCRVIYELTGNDCFAEDTGLEVEALNGQPGVHSARYAGEQKDDNANILKLLNALDGNLNRNAQFRTVICYVLQGSYFYFEGICKGSIASKAFGSNGFGYDPIFIPYNYTLTFGEISQQIKSQISHRKKAFHNFSLYLNT